MITTGKRNFIDRLLLRALRAVSTSMTRERCPSFAGRLGALPPRAG
jgi:hypothetical protein